MRTQNLIRFLLPGLILAGCGSGVLMAQAGKVWTAAELFTRNVGTKEDQDTAFPPHKIIGNLYYVGTRSLGSYLIVTPQGNILINSDYERTVPVIKQSVEKLGFKFTDIKILLGSHAHGDHMEGDALAQELSGAQVMAMAEDIPALQTMRTPSGKARPNYTVLHDGEKVTLGGTTLVAHLTPGHTRGCTTWTARIEDGGRSYDVVIIGSVGVNQGTRLVNNTQVPQIAEEYQRSFRILRGLKCDVPLGSHPAMYNLAEKYPKLGRGPNPFIDPQGYKTELDIQETAFNAVFDEQKRAANERK
jgi:metallo-beta-lactamase class B